MLVRLLRLYHSRGSKVLVFVGAGESPLRVAVQAGRVMADKGINGIKVRVLNRQRARGPGGEGAAR